MAGMGELVAFLNTSPLQHQLGEDGLATVDLSDLLDDDDMGPEFASLSESHVPPAPLDSPAFLQPIDTPPSGSAADDGAAEVLPRFEIPEEFKAYVEAVVTEVVTTEFAKMEKRATTNLHNNMKTIKKEGKAEIKKDLKEYSKSPEFMQSLVDGVVVQLRTASPDTPSPPAPPNRVIVPKFSMTQQKPLLNFT